jgi:transcriptional regulator with XRE-family HTH domain
MKTVGERIQQARKARGWSAEKLAEMVGYRHQSAIANIENRATTSGGQRLPKIAAALRVSPDWLLSGPDTHNVPFLPPKYLVPVPAEQHAIDDIDRHLDIVLERWEREAQALKKRDLA